MHPGFRRCLQRLSYRWIGTGGQGNSVARQNVDALSKVKSSYRSQSGGGKHSFWEWDYKGPTLLIAIVASSCLGGAMTAYADGDSGQNLILTKKERSSEPDEKKKRVVVLGTGWAGISFLKSLDTSLYDVKVVSPRNYFVFTPLLPSVTCGTVEARSITEPVRRIVRSKKKSIKYCQADCFQIDAANKRVICRPVTDLSGLGTEDFMLEYDYLVLAVGAQANTFNTPGVHEYCHFLKELEDAERIRESVVDCFENAELPHLSQEERKRLLHFVVIGGGPTGTEFAAELHDLVYEDFVKLYPGLVPLVKISVIQSADHILNMFDQRISQFAEQKFQRDGVEVKTACRVLEVTDRSIKMKDKTSGIMYETPYGMAVWSTGIGTRPVVAHFMHQIGQSDRRALATDEWLRVKGCEAAFAMGDCATIEQRKIMEDIAYIFELADKDKSGTLTAKEFKDCMELIRSRYPQIDIYMKRKNLRDVMGLLNDKVTDEKGEPILLDIEQFKKALSEVDSQMKALPATAQVAAQQGEYLARCFNQKAKASCEPEGPMRIRAKGRHQFHPFLYKHFGQFAPLGGEQAAAELPGDWVSIGRSTQWLWYSIYASKQVSWRTRALVVFDWTKRFIFGRDSSRM